MKIVIIQERGAHDKNREFRECENIKRSLLRVFDDVDVVIWGKGYSNFTESIFDISSDADAVLIIENYDTGWLPDLSGIDALKLFWSIDSHCVLNAHINTCHRMGVDVVLNSIKSHMEHFSRIGCETYYFPNAYPSDLIQPLDVDKSGVGFVGNVVNRGGLLNDIGIEPQVMVIGQDMVESVNKLKIHFNCNIANDINYRTFETLGCDTFLLTNYTESLEDLFRIGVDLVTYDSVEDCKNKIEYYLNNDEERLAISHNGYNTVTSRHTFDNRVKLLYDIIQENKK